jgi:hypothetical protein
MSDESKSKTLLDPELNPILNPLLAAHMGRWAEVYFTSPPEKREQAVSELLRELTRDSGSAEVIVEPARLGVPDRKIEDPTIEGSTQRYQPDTQEQMQETGRNLPVPLVEAIGNALSICESCGHLSVRGQKFCGMCGASLMNNPAQYGGRSEDQGARDRTDQGTVRYGEELPGGNSGKNGPEDFSTSRLDASNWEPSPAAEPFQNSYSDETDLDDEAATNSSLSFDQESQLTTRPPEFSISSYEQEPPARSYRLYIGLAVIVLLALLVYTTWRSNAGNKNSGTPELPAAVPDSTPSPAASNPPNEPTAGSTSQAPTRAASQTATANEPASANRGSNATGSDTHKQSSQKPRAQPLQQVAETPAAASAATQSGSEELATAEKYLKAGPSGAPEAVGWLWKAVARGNPTATLMLSDLYLHGEGVPKNCDQARLLLDAAARKGEQAAAQRLRSLQNYGCQ